MAIENKERTSVYALTHSPGYQASKAQEAALALEEGKVYFENNDIEMAIKCCEFAIRVSPENAPGANINLAFCYHMMGDHEKGWEKYEHRLYFYPELIDYMRQFGLEKKWGGMSELNGETVAVYCEQGLGDTIHMLRYLPVLSKLGCLIDVYCPSALARLVRQNKLIRYCHIIEEQPDAIVNPPWSYHIPSMSLPHLLKIYDPISEPYISVKQKLEVEDHNCLKIGIAWQGNKGHVNDNQRSCSIKNFLPLADNQKIKLYSLDPKTCQEPGIIDLSHQIIDMQSTAEVIAAMDLVISVDTAVLHLAGAMGKPAWALLPYHPDFRWGLYSTKTQWYPSLKLYRQSTPGDWDSVFAKVKDDLNASS